ncbi:MAG: hypothetical protein AB7V50_06745 [Vampirovibrionia bacterium]
MTWNLEPFIPLQRRSIQNSQQTNHNNQDTIMSFGQSDNFFNGFGSGGTGFKMSIYEQQNNKYFELNKINDKIVAEKKGEGKFVDKTMKENEKLKDKIVAEKKGEGKNVDKAMKENEKLKEKLVAEKKGEGKNVDKAMKENEKLKEKLVAEKKKENIEKASKENEKLKEKLVAEKRKELLSESIPAWRAQDNSQNNGLTINANLVASNDDKDNPFFLRKGV